MYICIYIRVLDSTQPYLIVTCYPYTLMLVCAYLVCTSLYHGDRVKVFPTNRLLYHEHNSSMA